MEWNIIYSDDLILKLSFLKRIKEKKNHKATRVTPLNHCPPLGPEHLRQPSTSPKGRDAVVHARKSGRPAVSTQEEHASCRLHQETHRAPTSGEDMTAFLHTNANR